VDLSAAPGATVRAAGDGVVGFAGTVAGRGVVSVTHGSLRTTYEPVIVIVHVGQRVAAGDVLGALAAGHAGCPTSACLHWGLLRGAVYLDPLTLLRLAPPRLLPLGPYGSPADRLVAGSRW
jgi:murein DD-endopeptidase MepM/ murein hydrolase activator NlpD